MVISIKDLWFDKLVHQSPGQKESIGSIDLGFGHQRDNWSEKLLINRFEELIFLHGDGDERVRFWGAQINIKIL